MTQTQTTMKYGFFYCLVSATLGAWIALNATGYFAKPGASANLVDPNLVQPESLIRGSQYHSAELASPLQANLLQEPPAAPDPTFSAEELINISVYEKAYRSVCNIDTTYNPGFRMMLGSRPIEGSGSGWVLDKQGHIVTNHHVIDNSDSITVTLFKGEPIPAKVVGTDPQNDIAVLRIDAAPELLHPVVLGQSSPLRVGQRIFAIGSPFGLERTMTIGIVSSLERSIKSPRTNRMIKRIIQVDAALNQGNSGGPLLDSSGSLVGMNTAIASATGENTGVGFAIPVDTIRRVVPQLLQFGEVRRAWLGIELFWKADNGLGVVETIKNGPAAQAGLRGAKISREIMPTRLGLREAFKIDKSTADILVAINELPVPDTDTLQDILDQLQPGQTVNLSIVRGGVSHTIPLQLGLER